MNASLRTSEAHGPNRNNRPKSAWWLLVALIGVGGCAAPARPLFPQVEPPLAWPPPPAPARIRYVGQLRDANDLHPPRKPLQGLSDALVGPAEIPRLYGPRAAVRTADGNRLWVADPGGRCLHLFDLERRTYRKITRLGDQPLLTPVDLCRGPAGSLYVCDSEAVAVHRLSDEDGRWLETLPLPEELERPAAVRFSATTGELFVVDALRHDIKVLDQEGHLVRILGRRGSGPGEFNFPCGLALGNHLLWVVDAGNQRVQALTPEGEPVARIGQAGDAPGDLALPKGVALDSDGHIYVVDARFENVQIFDAAGRLLLVFGQEGTEPGEFWLPAGIFIDETDRIWICDSYNGRIQVFDYIQEGSEADAAGQVRLPTH